MQITSLIDEFLRAVASVTSGRVDANVLMLRMGSAAAGELMRDAADTLSLAQPANPRRNECPLYRSGALPKADSVGVL